MGDDPLAHSDFSFLELSQIEFESVSQFVSLNQYSISGVRSRLEQIKFLLDINALENTAEGRNLILMFSQYLFLEFSTVYEDSGILVLNKPFDVRIDVPIKRGKEVRHWDNEVTVADVFQKICPEASKVWLCHQLGKSSSLRRVAQPVTYFYVPRVPQLSIISFHVSPLFSWYLMTL